LKRLGADHVINYREDAQWGMTARKLTTNAEGFDNIIEVGGTDTMSHSLKAIKFEGVITIIGLVTGFDPPDNIMEALRNICTLRGIHVGSRALMEEMMAAIEANGIQPVVDKRVFALEELKEGLEYLVSPTSLLLISYTHRTCKI
jgi:NADPH:quinone reductase-like Zn-dependent oxidoreductase